MDWRQALKETALQLEGTGVPDSSREAVYLLQWATGRSYHDWILDGGMLTESEMLRLEEGRRRRARREPMAYITGHQEFYGLDLTVTPAVLIPRPETEHLVEAVLDALDATRVRIVDVGTGSGAIALALKSRRPSWDVVGVDLCPEALAVASQNAWRMNLPITWVRSDLLEVVSGRFHVIVANLPYIDPDWSDQAEPELRFEPDAALYAPEQGLALMRRLVKEAGPHLEPDGQLFLECGFDQAAALRQALAKAGFADIAVMPDYAGHDRIVSGRWTSGTEEGDHV